MHHIAFEIKGKHRVEYIAGDGELIIDAARQAGVMIDSPCNSNGTCGKCKVRILSGEVGGNTSERLEEEAVA
ncbi:2Fe-2S iron-sulfur cluster-binding protein, partial [Eubacterium aggregans]|uniref:2Fe-2S iron-sulfur cluster-binding protein n=1 Tax=Eubacterium aggregans TaxID=81409 RepID=UPI003F3808E7